jgi:hypothetical protein
MLDLWLVVRSFGDDRGGRGGGIYCNRGLREVVDGALASVDGGN